MIRINRLKDVLEVLFVVLILSALASCKKENLNNKGNTVSKCECPFKMPYTSIEKLDTSRTSQLDDLSKKLTQNTKVGFNFDIRKYIKISPELGLTWDWNEIHKTTTQNSTANKSNLTIQSKDKFENLYFLTVVFCGLYNEKWCIQNDTIERERILNDYQKLSLELLHSSKVPENIDTKKPSITKLIQLNLQHKSNIQKIEFNGKLYSKLADSNTTLSIFKLKPGSYTISLYYYDGSHKTGDFLLTKTSTLNDEINF